MTPWVIRLIFLNGLVFLGEYLYPPLASMLALRPGLLLHEPWTAITYMFVHAGFMHIFFNMFGLFIFGPRVESRLGPARFLSLYFISGLGGALLSLATPGAEIVGASGALFGVMYAFAHYWPDAGIFIFPLPIPIPARIFVFGFAALSLVMGMSGGGGIAHFAHLGGFVAGFLYMRWVDAFTGSARFKAKTAAPSAPKPSQNDRRRWEQINRDDMHPVNREELDRILDKISRDGMTSLSTAEREFLERFSRR